MNGTFWLVNGIKIIARRFVNLLSCYCTSTFAPYLFVPLRYFGILDRYNRMPGAIYPAMQLVGVKTSC